MERSNVPCPQTSLSASLLVSSFLVPREGGRICPWRVERLWSPGPLPWHHCERLQPSGIDLWCHVLSSASRSCVKLFKHGSLSFSHLCHKASPGLLWRLNSPKAKSAPPVATSWLYVLSWLSAVLHCDSLLHDQGVCSCTALETRHPWALLRGSSSINSGSMKSVNSWQLFLVSPEVTSEGCQQRQHTEEASGDLETFKIFTAVIPGLEFLTLWEVSSLSLSFWMGFTYRPHSHFQSTSAPVLYFWK